MTDKLMTVVPAVKAGILDVGANADALGGDAAGTDYFFMPNDGKTVLVCVCGVTPKQITFTAVKDKYGRTETLAVTPGASETGIIGPFLPELWNQSTVYPGAVKFQPAEGGQATDKYLAVRVSNPT